jgi:hypothetical protein
MWTMRRIGLGAAVALLWMSGCEDNKTTIVVPDAAITVQVSASSDTLRSGGRVTLVATATTTPDVTEPLTFTWSADVGTFSNATDDTTTWTGPEAPGIYDVSVIATDGTHVAIGTRALGVDTYYPAVRPFYRGASYCQGCHAGGTAGNQYTTWVQSSHASAWQTLEENGVGADPYCIQCHTVGYRGVNADPALDNGGYDETAVARLQGVQCENCHGPGSEHPTDFTSVKVSLKPELCGECHNGPHHPTFDEWKSAGHNSVIAAPSNNRACVKCHNGIYAGTYLDDPAGFVNPASVADTLALTCAVCHDPHGNSNPGMLRNASVTDVVLPDGTVVPEAGAGRLCMSCHNGRRTPENIQDQIQHGSAHLGPHHSCQGDMLAGTGAWEGIAPKFPFTSSRHLAIGDGCVNCHTHAHGEGVTTFTGHNFRPTTEACLPCHGAINSFDQILAKQDYDGDGQIEGVQLEVDGLSGILHTAILDASATPEARAALEANFETAIGDTLVSTVRQREAAYNLFFVEFDSSRGVHNANYGIQLLQQSTLAVQPAALPRRAYILTE